MRIPKQQYSWRQTMLSQQGNRVIVAVSTPGRQSLECVQGNRPAKFVYQEQPTRHRRVRNYKRETQ